MTKALHALWFVMGMIVNAIGFRYAYSGAISWWYLAAIPAYAFTTGAWAFSSGWDSRR